MKTTTFLLILAALLASVASRAQQSPQTPQPTQPPSAQAQPATVSPVPCDKGVSNPPRKQGWAEQKTRAIACKHNKNLCGLPSSTPEITGGTPDTKPCPANATAKQVPPPKPQTQQAPNTTALSPSPAAGVAPPYVCPPNTILIPNHPYCLTADHSLVDAIPLPPGMTVPVSPAKTPAQTTTKQ
jgi:hypothetical protein